jgi:alpha-galactosidase
MMKKNTLISLALLLTFFVVQSQNKDMLYAGLPVFHGARVVGNYPNTSFLFTVPATGERPITFSAQNIPAGLTLDAATGIITGNVANPGEYKMKVTATNAKGKSDEELKIVIGERLCLTPAMGWNSWNVFTKTLDEKMVIEMTDAMVKTGMRDLGYEYINMDDFWHADSRDSMGRPVADPQKFPHGMKYLSDYVH